MSVALLTLAVSVMEERLGRPAQALLLVVPVAATGVLGGKRPAQVVAALATLSFCLVLPPKGSPAVRVADDLVALVVFSGVAFAVGGLVAHRIEVLGRIERQRSALLRSVSHDLRTPLASMNAAASVLQDDSWLDDEARRKLLDLIADEGARLDRLVANLLSLARIEAGALVPRRQALDMRELIEDSTARLGRLTAEVTVVLDIPADLPALHGDYTLIEQTVRNLVENAVRHSPSGGAVVVQCKPVLPDGMQLVVRDRGPGIPAVVASSVFEAFRTGSTAGTSGIGLAICKAVVEAHGGTIAVGGPPEGGAEFTVTLPLR